MSLKVLDLQKDYPEFNMRLSFTAETGELLTLLGPSGCGKTTTLHLIAGFITPDSGDILIDGRNVTHQAPHLRRVGVVFQDYALFPNMNVLGNIAFGLRMHGWEKGKIMERVGSLLNLIKLPGYERRIVTQLSGGEQQRIALARALAPNPQLLLLDEPLSALDAKLRKELRSEIKRIQRELGLTTIYVTHDQEEALAISNRIVVLQNGTIEQTGTAFEIHNRPRSLFVADFMGISNRLEARVVHSDGNYTEASTPEGRFIIRFPEKLEQGTPVTIVFRPERCKLLGGSVPISGMSVPDISILKSPESGKSGSEKRKPRISRETEQKNILYGRVTEGEYLGETTKIAIKTEYGSYTVKHSDGVMEDLEHSKGAVGKKSPFNRSYMRTGEPATLYVHPDDCWIIR
jgi:ABC-type Fe3+/spermidine/putrescine transport system ATPase subunit